MQKTYVESVQWRNSQSILTIQTKSAHVDDGKHVLKSCVSQKEKESAVDIHDSRLLGLLLAEIDDAQNQGDDNSLSEANLHDHRLLDHGEKAPP